MPESRRRLMTWLGRAGRAWIAVELTAGIVALCLLIVMLPAVECLMFFPADWSWKAALGASINGMVGAAYLGRKALVLPAELLAP